MLFKPRCPRREKIAKDYHLPLQSLALVACAVAYAVWPTAFHALMEYMAEENLAMLSFAIEEVAGGKATELQHVAAPESAKRYWQLLVSISFPFPMPSIRCHALGFPAF